MKELKIDPEFQALIPPLSDEEFQQLKENIIKDGCRDSLVTWNGTIVDGHNRYKICQENDISFNTEEKGFADREQAVEWIIRNQFGRRNLSPTQRCELALKLKPMIQKKAKENQRNAGGAVPSKMAEPVDTRNELAKIARVSNGTFSKAERILEKGTPEQIKRARKGGSGNSVNAIYKDVTGKKEPEKIRPKGGVDKKEDASKPEENNDKEVLLDNAENYQGEQPTGEELGYDSTKYKICSNCHTLMPLSAYLDSELNGYSDDVCGGCIDLQLSLAGKTMKYNRRIKTKEEKEIYKSVLDNLLGKGDKPADTIEMVIGEFKANFETFLKSRNLSLMSYLSVIKNEENNKKLMAALSEAVAAMNEWKGNYSYERL